VRQCLQLFDKILAQPDALIVPSAHLELGVDIVMAGGPHLFVEIDDGAADVKQRDHLGHIGIGAQKNVPNMGATNIPWKQFFDDGLRPNPSIEEKLKSVGITEDCRVIVLDADGVASAAVTMALRSFGYDDAGNYAGGLQDLLSR